MTKETQEARLAEAVAHFMSTQKFATQFTMSEVYDFVEAMRQAITVTDCQIDAVEQHMQECDDQECNRNALSAITHLCRRKNRLADRLENIAPRLARQKELLEAKLVESLGLCDLKGAPYVHSEK